MINIIDARDIARRDSQPTVKEWFRITSIQMHMKKLTPVIFDGTVAGAPVYALISNGRCVAMCDVPGCGGCEYVDPVEKIFFCIQCANGRSGKARPVIFPKDWNEICASLLERDMITTGGGDPITQTFNARPLQPDLRRDWIPGRLKQHPGLQGRVIVDTFDETPDVIRARTEEVKNARSL